MNYTLITGVSGGIGYELAKIFASHKNNLILVARNKEKLEVLATELKTGYGTDVIVFPADLSDRDMVTQLVEFINKKGIQVDKLVNNAGFGDSDPFLNTKWEKELPMINLNIIALTYLTKIFAKEMAARKSGKIMNVASLAAFQPGPTMAVYCATKAYVLSLSESVAYELRGSGVTVTTLCPGPTHTGFQDGARLHGSRIFSRKNPGGKEVAIYAYNAMMKGKRLAIHGALNRLMVFSTRLTPRKWVIAISGWLIAK